jgi:dTDP-4-dehydrorhamnose reductase
MAGTPKVLITGGGGQLGRALLRAPWPDSLHLVVKRRDELDITREQDVERIMSAGGYDAVVNAAAYTAVDSAEREGAKAYAVNHRGALNMARACARNGAILIHISTDYVFDGTKSEAYVEDDPVSPGCVYGRSKAAGEVAIRSVLDRHMILRTAWLFSTGQNNFVSKILQLARKRTELTVVADQVGNPTSAEDLSSAIVFLLRSLLNAEAHGDRIAWGTYHCANAEAASWCELAREAVDQAGPKLGCAPAIRPISSVEYPHRAYRPANSRLNCSKLETAFGIRLRPWRQALAPVVNEIVTELRP